MTHLDASSGAARRTAAALLVALAGAAASPTAGAKAGTPQDWLWLSSSLDTTTCVFTTTVTWAGFRQAKWLEVFVTEGYTGSKLVPTSVKMQAKDSPMTVVLPALAASTTWTMFYPWAQLLDSHGQPIPASLDFTGQQGGYCAAP